MGCTQSRENKSFTSDEIKQLKLVFQKYANSYFQTKEKNELCLEAFQEIFSENPFLAERLYQFMLKYSSNKKVDVQIFLDTLELIMRKPTNEDLNTLFGKYDKIEILSMILFPRLRKEIIKKQSSNSGISYSEALDFVQIFLNIFNETPEDKVNDSAARSIVDSIFPNNLGRIDWWSFCILIREQIVFLSRIITLYFKNKFLDQVASFHLPKTLNLGSLVKREQLCLLYLNNEYLSNASSIKLLYEGRQDNYNFNELTKSLCEFVGPTFILLQFVDDQNQKFTIGGFNYQKWEDKGIQGSRESYVFALYPKYKHYIPVEDPLNNYSSWKYQYCYLDTRIESAESRGLCFGGSSKESARIWIDGNQLQKCIARNQDQNYRRGNLIQTRSQNITCTQIEVYGLEIESLKKSSQTYTITNNLYLDNTDAIEAIKRSSMIRSSAMRGIDIGIQSPQRMTAGPTFSTSLIGSSTLVRPSYIEEEDRVKRSARNNVQTSQTYQYVSPTSQLTSYEQKPLQGFTGLTSSSQVYQTNLTGSGGNQGYNYQYSTSYNGQYPAERQTTNAVYQTYGSGSSSGIPPSTFNQEALQNELEWNRQINARYSSIK